MAKSYTQGRNLYGVWSKNPDTSNLAYGDQIANDDYRHLCALKDWPFLERRRVILTVALTQAVTLPYDCDLVREVSVIPTGSTITYTPRECSNRAQWDMLNLTPTRSDIPEWYFVFAGQLLLWPIPVNSNNSVYIVQKSRVIDLSVADYTTGTITTLANGGTAVTGSGTAWTSQMVGRYIRITMTDTAGTGDGLWYEIAGVASATSLTLTRAYGGTAIAAGSAAYTIGQMPLLPEAFHDLPWQWAAGTYWQKESDKERADAFLGAHGVPPTGGRSGTGRVAELIASYSSQSTNMVIDNGLEQAEINPNLVISL